VSRSDRDQHEQHDLGHHVPFPPRPFPPRCLVWFAHAPHLAQPLLTVNLPADICTAHGRGSARVPLRGACEKETSEAGTFAFYTDMKVIDVSGIVTRGYPPQERMNHAAFLRRLAPRYAILYGNRPALHLGPSLEYRRLAYFPKQGSRISRSCSAHQVATMTAEGTVM